MTKSEIVSTQLRMDKIIYATESVAINTACLITFIGYEYIENYLFPFTKGLVRPASVIIAISYTVYMGVGNFIRLQKINRLESRNDQQ